MKVGILTSGGDSPGMNTIVNQLRILFEKNKIDYVLIKNGFRGIIKSNYFSSKEIKNDFSHLNWLGGSYIGAGRLPELKTNIKQKEVASILKKDKIETIIVIGGDGSIKGGYYLSQQGINVINVPGTIDNNITASDMSLGYYSALESNVRNVREITRCSVSHKRFFIIQVMGGFDSQLAVDTAIASNADIVISHERNWDINNLSKKVSSIMNKKGYGVLITPDLLINDLDEFANMLEKKSGFETRYEVLGRSQRGANVSSYDYILASKFANEILFLVLNKTYNKIVVLKNGNIKSVDIKNSLKKRSLKNFNEEIKVFDNLKERKI